MDAPSQTPDLTAARSAWSLLGGKPGAVYAMHIGYAARAAQKGRTPEAPGYFLKPPTSLSTGGALELPVGSEIFGFEGEIALVIGRDARRVREAEAWGHVAAVTAANDLGVFDFRWADKGANVRSKGGDGFTPIGPTLLDASRLDPAAITVRTLLDGVEVQRDDTSTLLFSLPQIVSDLSQLITLEAGDVILTGTPAGASTFSPGQRVEVEVSARTFEGDDVSTGPLLTTAHLGEHPLPAISAAPRPTPEQWADASGRPLAEFTGDAGTSAGLAPHVRAKLEQVAVATLAQLLRKQGLNHVALDGLRPTREGARIVGTARTLRYVPAREDLFAAHGGGYNPQKQLFDDLHEGEVVVIEARGQVHAGTLGDVLALRAQTLGAAGIVTDGGVRDLAEVTEIGIPTFHGGGHPAVLGRLHVAWDHDLTVACGGATVQVGDVIVADADGVLVIPPELAEELADAALAQERSEEFIARQIRAGHPIRGLFPMDETWRSRYRAEQDAAERQETQHEGQADGQAGGQRAEQLGKQHGGPRA